MGQPVSILELARKTIRLKGHTVRDASHPHGDIAIEFIGLRPGEKLHEELLADDCKFGTDHPRIMRAVESHVPWPELEPALKNLEKACELFDFNAIKSFMEGLLEGADLAEQLRHLPALGNVLPLPSRHADHDPGAPRRPDA